MPTLTPESTASPNDIEIVDKAEEIIGTILETGQPMYSLRGLTKQHMEVLYSRAYTLYNAGRIEDAETLFTGLCLYDHTDYRHWMGLGLSDLLLKRYINAVNAFSYAAVLDMESPEPPFHAIECHLMLKDVPKALSACEAVILRANGKERYKDLAIRATAIRDALTQAIEDARKS